MTEPALKRAVCPGCNTDTYLHWIRSRWRCVDCGDAARPSRPATSAAYWKRGTIVRAIQHHAEQHGHPPTCKDWLSSGDTHPSNHTVRRVFGTWNDAIRAAGYEPRIVFVPGRCVGCGTPYAQPIDGCYQCEHRTTMRRRRRVA